MRWYPFRFPYASRYLLRTKWKMIRNGKNNTAYKSSNFCNGSFMPPETLVKVVLYNIPSTPWKFTALTYSHGWNLNKKAAIFQISSVSDFDRDARGIFCFLLSCYHGKFIENSRLDEMQFLCWNIQRGRQKTHHPQVSTLFLSLVHKGEWWIYIRPLFCSNFSIVAFRNFVEIFIFRL